MKTAIMQPYFFPYIGYYQLVSAVDTFVILDDVNFIKRGWINRNNILLDGKAHLFSIPVSKASQNTLISNTKLTFCVKEKEKFLRMIQSSYKKAPEFINAYKIIEEIINFDEQDLTTYLHNSLQVLSSYIGLTTKITRSSQINKDSTLVAQERIIEICKMFDTKIYINPSGGVELYSKNDFEKHNIALKFIDTKHEKIKYTQFSNEFVPYLSIIDAIMFNDKENINNILLKFDLL